MKYLLNFAHGSYKNAQKENTRSGIEKGKFNKVFGNGIIRDYKSKFGIIAGVTPAIDTFSALHAGLGERFLKFRMDRDIEKEDEDLRAYKAIANIDEKTKMKVVQVISARLLSAKG